MRRSVRKVGNHQQPLLVGPQPERSQTNLFKEKIWWKIGQNWIQNYSRIQTLYTLSTNSIKIMNSKVLISKGHYPEVHLQINSKSNMKKARNINMANSPFSQMTSKISFKKTKSLWKIVKKYLGTTKKHRKC